MSNRRRTHGKRCAESHSSFKNCRCVCRGKWHGEVHREPGLLQFVSEEDRLKERYADSHQVIASRVKKLVKRKGKK